MNVEKKSKDSKNMDKYNKDPISEVSKFCLIVEKLHYVFTYFSLYILEVLTIILL